MYHSLPSAGIYTKGPTSMDLPPSSTRSRDVAFAIPVNQANGPYLTLEQSTAFEDSGLIRVEGEPPTRKDTTILKFAMEAQPGLTRAATKEKHRHKSSADYDGEPTQPG